MTPDGFRKLALALPEAYESSHLDHPDFRVGKKIFATLAYPDERWAMVKLTPDQQTQFALDHPAIFVPAKGGWGVRGATNVKLRLATKSMLLPALTVAWKNVAPLALVRKHEI